MKKIILSTAAVAALASSAFGQDFIAGFDFQTINTSIAAGYVSDQNISGFNLIGDVTINSNDFTLESGLGAGNSTITAADPFWFNNGFSGGAAGDDSPGTQAIAATGTSSFEISWNGSAVTDTELTFMFEVLQFGDFGTEVVAGRTSFFDETFSVQLFDGATLVDTLTFNDDNLDAADFGGYTVTNVGIGALALDGVADARIVFSTNANGDNGPIIFDNIAITGNGQVVPEPSTYAAIAGALALGFVAYRRRK